VKVPVVVSGDIRFVSLPHELVAAAVALAEDSEF
jgi:hypothetical protein